MAEVVDRFKPVKCPSCGGWSARACQGRCACGALTGVASKRQIRAQQLEEAGWVRQTLNQWHRPGEDWQLYSLAAAWHTEFS